MLAATSAAFCLVAAATTFVVPNNNRVHKNSHESNKYIQFRGSMTNPEESAMPAQASWAPRAAALAAVLGLVAGLAPVAAPVRAEEAAATSAAPAAPELTPQERTRKELAEYAAKTAAAPSKEERVKRALEQVAKVEVGPEFDLKPGTGEGGGAIGEGKSFKRSSRKPVKEPKKKSEDGGFSFKLPSFSSPDSSDSAPKKKKFISPADELDEDELSLARPNPPLFWALFLGPSFIYLGFWVAGSLNIL